MLSSVQDKVISSSYVNGKSIRPIHFNHKGLDKKEVRTASAYTATAMIDASYLMGGLKLFMIGRNLLRVTGVAGESLNLFCDSALLMFRCRAHYKITKILDETPINSLKYKILKLRQNHVAKLISITVAAVAIDGISTAISVGAPIVSLPVNIISFLISITRIFGEHFINKNLKKALINAIQPFEKQNENLISNQEHFLENHAIFLYQFEQAQEEEKKTEEALETESKKFHNPYQSGGLLNLSDGRTSLQKAMDDNADARIALNFFAAQWTKSVRLNDDLESYFMAKQLITLIDPLLRKKAKLEEKKEKFEADYQKKYNKRLESSEIKPDGLINKTGVIEYEIMLNTQLKEAQKNLSNINQKLTELFELLERQDACLTLIERTRDEIEPADFQKSIECWEKEIDRTHNARRNLKFEKEYLAQTINHIKKEQKSLKKYLKISDDLEKVKEKIRIEETKKHPSKDPIPIRGSVEASPKVDGFNLP